MPPVLGHHAERKDVMPLSSPLYDCPTCGLEAQITDRFTFGGAPTGVEHVKLVCPSGHWCTPPVDRLPPPRHETMPADAVPEPALVPAGAAG